MSSNVAMRTSKNTVMLLGGTLTRMVASLVLVIYAAAQLGLEGFGRYSIALHYFELALGIAATAVGILLTRDLSRWPRHEQRLVTSAATLVLLLASGATIVMLGLSTCLGLQPPTIAALRLICIAILPGSFCALFEAIFVAKQRAEFVMLGTGLESVLRIGLSIAALWMGYRVRALVLIFVAVRFVLLLCYLICLRRVTTLRWDFHRRHVLAFAKRWRVFAAENWMAALYTSLDITVLSMMAGEAAVGVYNAAYKIIRLGVVVAKSYTTAVFPVLSRMYTQSRESFDQLSRDSIRVMLIVAMPISIGVSVLTERVLNLFYTEEYSDAAPVLRVLVWVLLIEFLNPFLSHTLFARGQQRESMHAAGISLVANLVATVLLVHRWGALGAAWGTLFAGSLACCVYLYYLMGGAELRRTAWNALRITLAAMGSGVALYFMRNAGWPLLLPVAIVVYGALLVIIRGVGVADLRTLRACLGSGATS